MSLQISRGQRLGAVRLNGCISELLQQQKLMNDVEPLLAKPGDSAAVSAAAGTAPDQQQQQLHSSGFTQLLQQLQQLHVLPLRSSSSSSSSSSTLRHGSIRLSSSLTPVPGNVQLQHRWQYRSLHSSGGHAAAAEPVPQAAQQDHHHQQQQQQHPADLPQLLPYQRDALDAVTSQLKPNQQRLLLQLPPSAAVNQLITHLTSHYVNSHSLLLLVSSSARAAALKATLPRLLNPGLGPALLGAQGVGPRVVPGEMVTPQHRVLIADLEQLQEMPSAAVQLMVLQQAPQVLAVYDDGFYHLQDLSLQQPSSSSSSSTHQGSAPEQQDKTPAQAAAGARALAQQLLQRLGFIPQQHTAGDPTRPLVCISSKNWQQLLLSSNSSSSNSRATAQGFALAGFKLQYPEALAAGLLKPAATVRIPTGTSVPPELLAVVDAAVLRALHSSSSSCSSSSNSSGGVDSLMQQQQLLLQQQGQQAISQLGALLLADKARTRAIAAACRTLALGGKVLVYACGQNHAREVNLALNLQGISSLALHEDQSPADQAAVLWAFENNMDRVLVVSSSCAGVVAASPLSCQVGCVVMGAPTLNPEVYAAAVAPGLLAGFTGQSGRGFGSSSGSSSGSLGLLPNSCLVVDFTDRLHAAAGVTAAAAAAAAAAVASPASAAPASSSRRRLRRSSTTQQQAAAGDTAAAAAAAAPPGLAEYKLSMGCLDLFGRDLCTQLPDMPEAFTAAVTAAAQPPTYTSSSSRAKSSISNNVSDQRGTYQQGVTGDLVWTLCANGDWAIPIKRGKGRTMESMRVLWLTKTPRGYLPQEEEGIGVLQPLLDKDGKFLRPMPLQKARDLAEAWLKVAHPIEASMRENGLEWRDRPMSDSQVIFCERHGLVYDREWTRGIANNMIDKFVVEVLRHPIEPRQEFFLRHLSPFAPSNMAGPRSLPTTYQHTAMLLQDALMQGLLTFSNSTAAAVAAAADSSSSSSAGRGGKKGGKKGSAAAAGSGAVLPSRRTMLEEQGAIWDAGLRPRYTWMVLREGQQLLLDLLNGSYLWLRRAAQQQQQQQQPSEELLSDSKVPAAAGPSNADVAAGDQHPAQSPSGSNASSSSSKGAFSLDPTGFYDLLLELPDGSKHPVSKAEHVRQLLEQFEQQQAQGSLPAGGFDAGAGSGSSSSSSSSSSSDSSRGKGAVPVPLPVAMSRAEGVATGLLGGRVVEPVAFLGRAHVVRLCSMVGGWRVPAESSQVHPCMPASHQQLEQLRHAGLPVSRKYTGYDAHRELLRYQKTKGLPEARATPSQLARIRELQLPLTDAAAATLTYAQAKAMLYKAQLIEELAAKKFKAQRLKDLAVERRNAKQLVVQQGAAGKQRAKDYQTGFWRSI